MRGIRRRPAPAVQRVARVRAYPQRRGVLPGLRLVPVLDHLAHVRAVRDLDAARRPGQLHRPGDAAEPEHPRRVAGPVVAGDVPAAAPVHHAPRLEGPLRHLGTAARQVGEGDRPAVADRLPQRAERGLLRGQSRLDAGRRARRAVAVGLPARRAQLKRGARGRAGQLGGLPDPRRDAEDGGLVGLQVDLWQLVVLAADPVAEVVVDRVRAAGLQRNAQVAKLLLVPLEHALERLLLIRVPADRGPDLLGGQVPARGEQEDDDGQEAFGPALRQRDLPRVVCR